MISAVTGQRPLQAGPMGRYKKTESGFELDLPDDWWNFFRASRRTAVFSESPWTDSNPEACYRQLFSRQRPPPAGCLPQQASGHVRTPDRRFPVPGLPYRTESGWKELNLHTTASKAAGLPLADTRMQASDFSICGYLSSVSWSLFMRPVGFEPTPCGLKVRCAAVTPQPRSGI